MTGQEIVNINEYELTDSAEAFTTAIQAVAERTRAEGHPGVLRYHFYVNADAGTAAATIVYADAIAWVEHHKMAYGWEEMPRLQSKVALQRVTLMGPINDDMRKWIQDSGLKVPITICETLAAGFAR